MQKFSFSSLWLRVLSGDPFRHSQLPDARWDSFRDPLAHPDIAVMSERELADLPLGQLRMRWRS